MSEKNLDNKNRHRNKTVGFRVSPEEWDTIERCVEISGLAKQDYILRKLLDKTIVVKPNIRIYTKLEEQLKLVLLELKENSNEDVYELIEQINKTLYGLKGE